eukprot:scaffold100131_cov54-Phaeocystis_antarctica.AAC.2
MKWSGGAVFRRCRRAPERAARAPTPSVPLSPTPDWTDCHSSAAPRAARPTPPLPSARRCTRRTWRMPRPLNRRSRPGRCQSPRYRGVSGRTTRATRAT